MDHTAALVYRGNAVESRHRAHAVVVDRSGDVVASLGDPGLVTFTRSALKPFQLAPLVAEGHADGFGFTDAELAVMTGSHSGEAHHVKAVRGILKRIGLDESALRCGAHAPYGKAAARALDGAPSAVHNNCSGKHAGFLALAVALDADPATYLDPDHPVQARVRAFTARVTGVPESDLVEGTDGCTAPNYAVPLMAAARAFARLARPDDFPEAEARALDRIRSAMTRYPEMVAGTDRFDTDLMDAADERLAGKIGGEGIFGVADAESGLGLLVKIEDGNARAIPPVVTECCRQLAWLDERAFEVLGEHWRPAIRNHNGIVTGRIEPVIRLHFAQGGMGPGA